MRSPHPICDILGPCGTFFASDAFAPSPVEEQLRTSNSSGQPRRACPSNDAQPYGTPTNPAAFLFATSGLRSYPTVVATEACPMSCCTSATSAPASSMSPANVRRRWCGLSDTSAEQICISRRAAVPRSPSYLTAF